MHHTGQNTQAEITTAYAELRGGGFYRSRARGNYRLAADESDVPYSTAKVDVQVRVKERVTANCFHLEVEGEGEGEVEGEGEHYGELK